VVDLVDENVSAEGEFRATYGKGTPVEFDLSEVDGTSREPARTPRRRPSG
jgi:hypothetical protein